MYLLIYSGQNYIFVVVNFLGLPKASLMEEIKIKIKKLSIRVDSDFFTVT